MAETIYLTQEGLEKIRNELQELRTRGRSAIAKAIQEAREKGDLSENAEYHAAKEEQALLEMKIAQLEQTLLYARVIDNSRIDTSRVMMLSRVKVRNVHNNQVSTFQIVSESEANAREGKISVNSPIAKGLIGKAVSEVVEVQVPLGTMRFEILEISL